MGDVFVGKGYRVEVAELEPGLIEIRCEGHMPAAAADEYLPHLERLVRAAGGGVRLLYNGLPLKGYDFAFPTRHIEPFKTWFKELDKVAVAHTIPTISFAIVTVSLAAGTNIKGFPTREAALRWLRTG